MTTVNKALVSALIAALAFLCVWSLKWGIADYYTLSPRHSMALWEEAGALDNAEWEEGMNGIASARGLNPGHPEYDFYQGKLYEWKALQAPVWSSKSRKNQEEAIRLYQQALSKRPSWNLAWISLAQSKFLLQQMDDDIFKALELAMFFSPWDQLSQMKIGWIGMSIWDHLSIERKEMVMKNIEWAMGEKKPAKFMIFMATQQGREGMINKLMNTDWKRDMLKKELKKRENKASNAKSKY